MGTRASHTPAIRYYLQARLNIGFFKKTKMQPPSHDNYATDACGCCSEQTARSTLERHAKKGNMTG